MLTAAKVTIERAERKCSYNEDVRSGKIKDHPIYDWNVFIDGEYRAQFRPGVYKGYNLHDADGFKIKGASNWGIHARRSDVAAKAEFEGKIRECLDKLLIPTLGQLANARENLRVKFEADEAARKEEIRVERIRNAALDLFAALKGILSPDGRSVYGTPRVTEAARAAIAKAEGDCCQHASAMPTGK